MPQAKQTSDLVISIPKPVMGVLPLLVTGDTRLVVHNWSAKAKGMMVDKAAGKARTKKPPKDPEQEYRDSLYQDAEGWHGVPAISFKKAAVDACRFCEGITMIQARGVMRVLAQGIDVNNGVEIVRIDGDGPHMREDPVRVQMTTDLRYRAEWRTWQAKLKVVFNRNVVSYDHIFHLFVLAGLHCGIGEGRPSAPKNTLDWGCFSVEVDEAEKGAREAA